MQMEHFGETAHDAHAAVEAGTAVGSSFASRHLPVAL
jgi:hypothetical protein